MRVWITKYALSTGIFSVDAEIKDDFPTMASWRRDGWAMHAHGEGREWHKTELAALQRAEDMRNAKIASLKKSIAKFERMNFAPTKS